MDLKECTQNLERQFLNTFDAQLGLIQTSGYFLLFAYLFHKTETYNHKKIIFYDDNSKMTCHLAVLSELTSQTDTAGRRDILSRRQGHVFLRHTAVLLHEEPIHASSQRDMHTAAVEGVKSSG